MTANVIANNLIEVGAYKYGMRITGGNKNTFLSNGFFDSDAINTLGCYWFSSDGGIILLYLEWKTLGLL